MPGAAVGTILERLGVVGGGSGDKESEDVG